jgi:SAM-dependent methyltransferase
MSFRSGAAAQSGSRDPAYYLQARPEVADLVPAHCRRVLDVGCGAGAFGQLLQQRGHEVSGVELVPAAAAEARAVLGRVEVMDIEALPLPFAAGSFDAIVFADVLEHLIDPWRVLRDAAIQLAPGGYVIASVPNVQNWSVLRRLALGRWDYRHRGILDRGHLRFFTARSIRSLFAQAGLRITVLKPHYRKNWPRRVLSLLTAGRCRGFLARQYLVVGVKDSAKSAAA